MAGGSHERGCSHHLLAWGLVIAMAGPGERTAGAGAFWPAATEEWEPVPPRVAPASDCTESPPPADATVLFDGSDLAAWINVSDGKPAQWPIEGGELVIDQAVGDIRTRRTFQDYQLHIEWLVPRDVIGEGQRRGNSGVFLGWTGDPSGGYEIQVLDPHDNPTYVNGMAGSIYKQAIPLVNPGRPPGQWQCYDIAWRAPRFSEGGELLSPASVTLFFNGILVQNNVELRGRTVYTGEPRYSAHGPAAIMLQAHGDPGPPVRFRNIWLRQN